ncbi:MAG: ADP-forming succinate--CoA ligase subunit beta, partial [bacterium]
LGKVADTPEQARAIAVEIGRPVVIKAQVLVGGRGKAGGIKVANTPDEAFIASKAILGMSIKGLTVKKVLVGEAVNIVKEYYAGIAFDRDHHGFTAIASASGGIDIEEVAAQTPEKITKLTIDPYVGFMPFQTRILCFAAGFEPAFALKAASIFTSMYRALLDHDADLVEINPLAQLADTSIVALDAKVTIDDNALFRHQDLLKYKEVEGEDPLEVEAKVKGIQFVRLDGDIAVVGNGAGLVMTTMDAVKRAGGKPANFLDLGGGASEEETRKALELLLKVPGLKSIFINVFGGITRGDEVAHALLKVYDELKPRLPMVIRMTGNRAKEGLELLKGSPFKTAEDMTSGAALAVRLAYNP